jgi:uncharacterized protein (TIGR01319 family)
LTAIDMQGRLFARAKTVTDADIGLGIELLTAELTGGRGGTSIAETIACSSAGGGLRVAVVGLETRLTLEAARRTAATAGARIVAAYAGRLNSETGRHLVESSPDVILLTGGTNGGEQKAVVANAATVDELVPHVPVVYAGNESARDAVLGALRAPRLVSVARNVLPEIGLLDVADAQAKIREIFIDNVIGHGRLASSSRVTGSIRMPTPAAVLEATRALSFLGKRSTRLRRPVVVDVGGATTDVHSAFPHDENERRFGRGSVPNELVMRTVEGDLGLRENALSLVEEVQVTSCVKEEEVVHLRAGAELRMANKDYVPRSPDERKLDERLAVLASATALTRHAGYLQVALSDAGAALRKTGRDLREASCLIGTGGIFEHASEPRQLLAEAAAIASERGALVPASAPVLVDRSYVLAAAGLLSSTRPALAQRLLAREIPTDANV